MNFKLKPFLWSFQKFFPSSKKEWFKYFSISLPLAFGAVLYAFNSFVDNFMVTTIPHGVESLNYANSWTAIVSSFFIGIGIFGSVLVGQFYGAKNYKSLRMVINFRIILCFNVALIFAIVAWIIPGPFLSVFSVGKDADPKQTIEYLRWIAVSWCLMGISFNTGNLLRETTYSKTSFLNTSIVLATNIIFNSIFVYGLNYGAVGTAYASIIARLVAIVINVVAARIVNKNIFINYLKFYEINLAIVKQFGKRLPGMFLYSVAITFVVLRTPLWYQAYPNISDPYYTVKGATVLGLTSTITNIMTSAFASLNGSINFFIGRHLANDNPQIARTNAYKMMGVNFLIAIIFSIMTFIIVVILVNIPHFSEGLTISAKNSFIENQQAILTNSSLPHTEAAFVNNAVSLYYNDLLLTVLIVCLYNPIWMQGLTSLRIIGSGGRSNLTAFSNILTNLVQLGWLALIAYFIVPNSKTFINSLPLAYFLFFISDILKTIIWTIMQEKIDWNHNLNHEYNILRKAK